MKGKFTDPEDFKLQPIDTTKPDYGLCKWLRYKNMKYNRKPRKEKKATKLAPGRRKADRRIKHTGGVLLVRGGDLTQQEMEKLVEQFRAQAKRNMPIYAMAQAPVTIQYVGHRGMFPKAIKFFTNERQTTKAGI